MTYDFIAINIQPYHLQSTRLKRNIPIDNSRIIIIIFCLADNFIIQFQSGFCSIRVTNHTNRLSDNIIPDGPRIHRRRLLDITASAIQCLQPRPNIFHQTPASHSRSGISSNISHRFCRPKCLTKITARFDLSTKIQKPRIESTRRPSAGFPQIVDTSPQKLPQYVFFIPNRSPCFHIVPVFTSINHTTGIF